ncbi:hypothetical protein U6A24_20665 [Aquimarina gracilis]|uniref:Uncharacterized protein n=1 Tax=Aquimarina gracilis TaxID=874422 RepID=A0ABU6A1E0_9FLAO|nr:hypothetical protein [Aquimarina gracilis]MEB3347902.1 hypothetical protein [Aquimarina gracilis]
MKKKLEAELISIAHRILQLKGKSSLPQLQEEARQLYEKLTILNFTASHFAGPQPTIGQVHTALEKEGPDDLKKVQEKIKAIIEPKEEPVPVEKPEILKPTKKEIKYEEKVEETLQTESKPELVIEEINARVTEDLFVPASATTEESNSFATSQYNRENPENTEEKPKSLNEQLKKDIHIGLNDRLAFIKNLFEGSTPDYNRVLSQLGTMRSKIEAEEFINKMVKPDYNNWESKEEYEERFMDVVLSKFEH